MPNSRTPLSDLPFRALDRDVSRPYLLPNSSAKIRTFLKLAKKKSKISKKKALKLSALPCFTPFKNKKGIKVEDLCCSPSTPHCGRPKQLHPRNFWNEQARRPCIQSEHLYPTLEPYRRSIHCPPYNGTTTDIHYCSQKSQAHRAVYH